MPRARLLKPGFFKNVTLAKLSERHRLLYEGLWLLADREGRLKDEPAWIKAEVFPYEDVDVDPLLTDLQHEGFILRYAYIDRTKAYIDRTKAVRTSRLRFRAIQILAFSKHQTPHHREPASTIPPPTSRRSRPVISGRAHAHDSLGPALGSPTSSRTVPDPVPVLDPVTGDPVPKDKSSAADAAPPPNGKNGTLTGAADNLSVITKLAHDAIREGTASNDLPEVVKIACAQHHIAYNSAVVRKAIESAQAQQRAAR